MRGRRSGLAREAPFGVKELPGDLKGDGGLAGPGSERQQDAPVSPRNRLQRRRDGLVLVVPGFPLAAVGLEVHGAEGIAPWVRLGKGAVPQLLRGREGQVNVALDPVGHVDAVPLQPVRGIGEAGAEASGVVLGLPDAVAVAEPRPFGLSTASFWPLWNRT